MIENRVVGIKSRELYEAPAASYRGAHGRSRRRPDDRLPRCRRARARKVRAPSGRLIYAPPATGDADRLRAIGAAMRTIRRRRRGRRQRPRRRDDAVRLRERARSGDRRGTPSIGSPARSRGDNTIFVAAKDGTTAQRARGRARRLPRGRRHGMTLWSGRVGGSARSRRVGVPPRRRRGAAARTTARRASSTRSGCTRPGCSRTTELAEAEARLAEIAQDPAGYLDEDEDVHSRDRAPARRRRPQDPCGALAQRPGRGRLPALRRSTPAREAREEIDALALVVLVARRGRGRHAHARLHASPARPARHARASPARLGRDARPRPHAAFARGRRGRAESPLGAGALAGSTLGLPGAAGPDAQLDRRRRRPRLRARLPLRRRRALHPPLADRRGARALVRRASSAS